MLSKEQIKSIIESNIACKSYHECGASVDVDIIAMKIHDSLLDDRWRDARKLFPVTPFIAYWTDDRITILEDGDSVSYALTGDPDKRVIAWIPLSEISKQDFS